MRRPLSVLALALALAACDARQSHGAPPPPKAAAGTPPPAETDPPNARNQHPAFAGQTRAPALTTNTRFQVQTVASGLDHPWSLAFLPDGRALVTERAGRLRILNRNGALSPPVAGVPRVVTGEQSGLFEVARGPDGLVYLSFMEARPGGRSGLTVDRGKLVESAGGARLEGLQPIFRAEPAMSGNANLGGRLVFAPDKTLFISVGDRFSPANRAHAQTLDNHIGKVVRINADGSAPKDNPFVGRPGAKPEIWTYGHRNPEAMAINPATKMLWIVEHGARGGDEVNILQPGKNYGWPVISYGVEYSGAKIGEGTQKAGMEQPIYYWDPVIAPSGMAFYEASLFPAWKGNLFVGGLASTHLARLTLKGDRVVGEEWLLDDLGQRIRDVRQGPDGALWLLTDEADGKVLRLAPK